MRPRGKHSNLKATYLNRKQMSALFADRAAAGGALARQLQVYAGCDDVVVLALPRGGVPVAWEVARALRAKLDVLVVHRLYVPYRTGPAMGAIAGTGCAVFMDRQVMAGHYASMRAFEDTLAPEREELARRRALYCGAREPAALEGRTVIVVDDGVATEISMRAALAALRCAKPGWISWWRCPQLLRERRTG